MGTNLSSYALTTFEIIHECFISISAGVLGWYVLVNNGIKNGHLSSSILITVMSIGTILYMFQHADEENPSENKVIFITGCDSGLGFSLAQHACELGFTVLAGCFKLDSNGAKELRNMFGNKIHNIEIDVTRITSVEAAVEVIERFFKTNPNYSLWALVNNAGVMIFGEFEWLTERIIKNQLGVNLEGTLRVTKMFCPLLRKHRGRIITVSSHCALATLPGLSVYGATKSALLAWSDGLRVELKKYGVDVISFIPGSFPQQSNIMANQVENCIEMQSAFTPEQREFYGEYFKRYNSYLSRISAPAVIKKIDDPSMYEQFNRALLDVSPKSVYINEPPKYKLYHLLFKFSPVKIRDYFILKFMNMPEYYSTEQRIPGKFS